MNTDSLRGFLLFSDTLTSIVAFTIVNEKYQDDLLDPSGSRYSDFQINIQRNVSKETSFFFWFAIIDNKEKHEKSTDN